MSAQIEVALKDGEVVKIEGNNWFVQPDERLEVLDTDQSERVVATFAPRSWVSVRRAEPQQGGMSIGSVNIDVNVDDKAAQAFRESMSINLSRLGFARAADLVLNGQV